MSERHRIPRNRDRALSHCGHLTRIPGRAATANRPAHTGRGGQWACLRGPLDQSGSSPGEASNQSSNTTTPPRPVLPLESSSQSQRPVHGRAQVYEKANGRRSRAGGHRGLAGSARQLRSCSAGPPLLAASSPASSRAPVQSQSDLREWMAG